MKKFKLIGVVGAGTMGAALAQKFATEGFRVFMADREMKFVEKGFRGIKSTLKEGIERKLFTEGEAADILGRISGTDKLTDLRNCDLVIEAIFEDFESKITLFRNLSSILPKDTILATNTSSFSITELSKAVSHPERFIGMHYFYHAAKNRLVEIIPGAETSTETLHASEVFSALTGKDPIICKDRHGFAVNRFFVPWLNEAVRMLEEGIAGTSIIDRVGMKTFGIGIGPFALMNATGVPIAYHSQKTLEVFGNFYKVSGLLKKQALGNKPWHIETVEMDEVDEQTSQEILLIRERMLGSVFFACSQILDEGVCTAADLNRGARIGLQWRKGPIELMETLGEDEVRRLIQQIADRYQTPLPGSIGSRYWKMEFVTLNRQNNARGVAFITINRPEDLNALNERVLGELSEKFTEAENDSGVNTICFTGVGKAFVAGADIKFFLQNIRANRIEKIVAFTRFGIEVFRQIDQSSKKVVAIINGITLGGGLELVLCADLIAAVPNATIAFPETGIGIYPGLGGINRTRERIGKGLAKYLIYTGQILNAKEAQEIGLVDAIVQREDIISMKTGEPPFPSFQRAEKAPGQKWQALEDFFDKNLLDQIVNSEYTDSPLPRDEVEKLRQIILRKAPLALKAVERLIEGTTGDESELEEIVKIFSTEDALLGLSSVGKRVEFQGK